MGALAQSAKCATAPVRHQYQVKNADERCMTETLRFHKTVSRIETSLTPVHMKPFSMKECVRRRDRLTLKRLLMRSESNQNN